MAAVNIHSSSAPSNARWAQMRRQKGNKQGPQHYKIIDQTQISFAGNLKLVVYNTEEK